MPNTLLDNLITHVSFDNDATDQHGTHDFTLVNTPTYPTDAPLAWTKSMLCEIASSEYAYTADHADWDALAGTGEWSVGFWFKATGVSGTQFLLNNWAPAAADRSWIVYLSGSTLRLRTEVADVAKDTDWGLPISSGQWFCCQVWRSGDSQYLSVDDDTPVSTALGTGASIDAWTQSMAWATRALSPASYFGGNVSGLSIWSADIGSGNRTEFYQGASGLHYSSWTASGGGLSVPVAMGSYRRRRVG